MKIASYVIASLALALAAYQQFEINTLKDKLVSTAQVLKDQDEMILHIEERANAVNDGAIVRENRLQDSLEERIGDLERFQQDWKFIHGEGKKRKRK